METIMNTPLVKGLSVTASALLILGVTLPALGAEYRNASEYLQVELDLTEEEAQKRLTGERLAARARHYAIALVGEGYAGSWFDPNSNTLVVATVDESDFSLIKAAGAMPTLHEHSLSSLKEMQRQLEAFGEHHDTIEAGLVAWYVDVIDNSVVVEHLNGHREATELIIAQLRVNEVPVRLDAVDEFPVVTYDIRGGDKSDNTSQGYPCSIGLSITDGYIIAGHCGHYLDQVSGYNGVSQGFYGQSDWTNSDRAWVETNSNWTPMPSINNYSGGTLSITGNLSGLKISPVNSTVCRYGITTGVKCGIVKAIGVNVTISGVPLSGMTRTTACIDFGDSGGPFLSSSGHHAQGTTTGGTAGQCPQPTGGYSYFETANNTLSQYSKIMLTTHGANAPTAGSASCLSLGYGAYICTLSGYDSQGPTSVIWSASNGDGGSGLAMSGNCATSQTINVNISATNPYGSGSGGTSFFCHAGPLP